MPQFFCGIFGSVMFEKIREIFLSENIEYVGVIPASEMTVIRERLLPDAEIKSCIVFLAPYKTDYEVKDHYGVSLYARSQDYHIYFSALYGRIIPRLSVLFPNEQFFGFADHSPVNEKLAAAKAGLGRIGRNSLLINEKYGSFVFIGSLLTTLPLPAAAREIQGCDNCEICVQSCPVQAIAEKGIVREKCLSALTQKKNKNENEWSIIKKHGAVWGCDVCQNVCPMNQNKARSKIDFFAQNRLDDISEALLVRMPDEVFKKYPFSWRGKETILQNLKNLSDNGT